MSRAPSQLVWSNSDRPPTHRTSVVGSQSTHRLNIGTLSKVCSEPRKKTGRVATRVATATTIPAGLPIDLRIAIMRYLVCSSRPRQKRTRHSHLSLIRRFHLDSHVVLDTFPRQPRNIQVYHLADSNAYLGTATIVSLATLGTSSQGGATAAQENCTSCSNRHSDGDFGGRSQD